MSRQKNNNKKCRLWNFENLKNSDLGVMLDPVNIEIKGNREATIEGLKSIAQYDENMIKINMNKMAISFFGRNLEIKCLSADALVIKGFITSIEYET